MIVTGINIERVAHRHDQVRVTREKLVVSRMQLLRTFQNTNPLRVTDGGVAQNWTTRNGVGERDRLKHTVRCINQWNIGIAAERPPPIGFKTSVSVQIDVKAEIVRTGAGVG